MRSRGVLRSGPLVWLCQAVTGLLLVVLGSIHMIAQHLLAPGGLRTHADVVAYLRQPAAFAIEVVFLAVVTVHALLGVRAILLDLGPRRDRLRRVDLALLIGGTVIVCYGLGLTLWVVLG